MRVAVGSLIACLLVACPSAQERSASVSSPELAARAPAEFRFLFGTGLTREELPRIWVELPYDSITLERTPCYGTCPVYTVTLSRWKGGASGASRTAEGLGILRATRWRGRDGAFVGQFTPFDYGRLCYLLKQSRFETMARSYGEPNADSSTSIFTVRSGAATQEVRVNGGHMPIELWAIRQAIEDLTEDIRWTRQ